MRKLFYLIPAILTLSGCNQTFTSGDNQSQQEQEQSKTGTSADAEVDQSNNAINPNNIFTLPDAEKILGEPAHLSDSTLTMNGDVSRYLCSYTANSKDQKSGKTGAVYFLLERYGGIASAREKYTSIMKANEDHGIKELQGVGDEAYFHSDGENFYFIMVRKGVNVFNMKVNKITSTTSLDEFNLIARNITAAL